VKENPLRIAAGEPTPLQLSSWRRLWAILLAPVESQSASAVTECTAKPESPTPLRRQPKRLDADEPIRPKSQSMDVTDDGTS
jgi:hypothetical protein